MTGDDVRVRMPSDLPTPRAPLKILCLEDNPLIVMHLEQMIEDLGHVCICILESFADLKDRRDEATIDCALVDIDLADGRTGPDAAAWLFERGIPTLFVTGQEAIANDHRHVVVDVIAKPVSAEALREALDRIALDRRAA